MEVSEVEDIYATISSGGVVNFRESAEYAAGRV